MIVEAVYLVGHPSCLSRTRPAENHKRQETYLISARHWPTE
jgi:hypothetical protein